MNKTDALWDVITDFTGISLITNAGHYERAPLRGVVICCVDSMDTRVRIWREVKKYEPELYIDTRMGAEVGKVLVVHPSLSNSCRKYEEDLYPSSEAYHAPCTAKATIYCAAGLASFIGATIGAYVNNRRPAGIIIDFRNMQLLGGVL
jgi:hypothetical protein